MQWRVTCIKHSSRVLVSPVWDRLQRLSPSTCRVACRYSAVVTKMVPALVHLRTAAQRAHAGKDLCVPGLPVLPDAPAGQDTLRELIDHALGQLLMDPEHIGFYATASGVVLKVRTNTHTHTHTHAARPFVAPRYRGCARARVCMCACVLGGDRE